MTKQKNSEQKGHRRDNSNHSDFEKVRRPQNNKAVPSVKTPDIKEDYVEVSQPDDCTWPEEKASKKPIVRKSYLEGFLEGVKDVCRGR